MIKPKQEVMGWPISLGRDTNMNLSLPYTSTDTFCFISSSIRRLKKKIVASYREETNGKNENMSEAYTIAFDSNSLESSGEITSDEHLGR